MQHSGILQQRSLLALAGARLGLIGVRVELDLKLDFSVALGSVALQTPSFITSRAEGDRGGVVLSGPMVEFCRGSVPGDVT